MESLNAQLHDYELEEAVLGAVLLEKDAFDSVTDWDDEVFYKPEHKAIAYAISVLSKQDKPIDILTVTAHLGSTGRLQDAGGAYKVATLGKKVGGTQNTEYHYRLLYQFKLLRNLSEMGFEIKNEVYQSLADPFEIISRYVSKMEGLTAKLSTFNIKHVSKLSDENIIRVKKIVGGEITPGVPTGFDNITRKTGGWQKSDLIIFAGRPGMGKTALALQCAIEPAIQFSIPTVVFSLEMGNTPITSRVQSLITGYSSENIIRGNMTKDDIKSLEMSMKAYANMPVFIDDTPSLSIYQLRTRLRRLVREKNVQLAVIDYLQLMTVDGSRFGNREQEISFISRSLKALAKELDIPIIALSQLSRDVEKRSGTTKRPNLSDLRESGAIEQDADSVYFIYRPEYYGATEFEDGASAVGMAELICAKNRHAGQPIYRLTWDGRCTKFADPNQPKPAELPQNTNFENEF